jgi:hypothetical protein
MCAHAGTVDTAVEAAASFARSACEFQLPAAAIRLSTYRKELTAFALVGTSAFGCQRLNLTHVVRTTGKTFEEYAPRLDCIELKLLDRESAQPALLNAAASR